MVDRDYERTALEMQDKTATMSDDQVLAAYMASDAEADDPWQTALANALQERNIDF